MSHNEPCVVFVVKYDAEDNEIERTTATVEEVHEDGVVTCFRCVLDRPMQVKHDERIRFPGINWTNESGDTATVQELGGIIPIRENP